MKAEQKEKLISEIMNKSGRQLLFSDFEDRLMDQIHEEARLQRNFRKDIKLSWFFLIIGLCLGMFISSFFLQLYTVVLGITARTLILLIQAFFFVILLTQFDRLVELTRKKE